MRHGLCYKWIEENRLKVWIMIRTVSAYCLRLVVLGAVGCGIALSLAACNTVEGIGKDVKKAGSAIEGSANKNK